MTCVEVALTGLWWAIALAGFTGLIVGLALGRLDRAAE
jgi:hypothetical protein